ncbi:MAG: patatin-like phospholipase family protein, partial [Alphaproteobacteria bacterium]
IVREKLKNARPDILIRPPVNEFRILEFYKAENIFAAAAPVKEELKRALDGYLEKAV